ncbi:MAG: hypothetical protein JKY65_01375 [Planctomycetes bacterium]|nr:hypothetical protein [Planctomycetota bacterium]
MGKIKHSTEGQRRYRVLLRHLARGGTPPAELDLILRIAGRDRSGLEHDLSAWRERVRLASRAEEVVALLDRVAIAREGYLLVRQSARRTCEEAEARERRARATYDALAHRMEQARAADDALKALLPCELRSEWEAAEVRVQQTRTSLRDACLGGRNAEHLEADLEAAESHLEAVRASVLEP